MADPRKPTNDPRRPTNDPRTLTNDPRVAAKPAGARRHKMLLLGAGLLVVLVGIFAVGVALTGFGAASTSSLVPTLPPTAAEPAPAASPTDPAEPGDAAEPTTPAPAPAPVAVFLGDSYTQGYGAVPVERRWSSLVAANAGWTEVNQGLGGTGYVTTADLHACGLDYCPTYVERVPGVIAAAPDIVVVAGGQNDRWALAGSPDQVRAAVDATFAGIRQGLPNARMIAVGPSTAEAPTALIVELDGWVRAAAERVGAEYVSLIEPVLIEEAMIAPDRVHVTDAGYRALADRVLAQINR